MFPTTFYFFLLHIFSLVTIHQLQPSHATHIKLTLHPNVHFTVLSDGPSTICAPAFRLPPKTIFTFLRKARRRVRPTVLGANVALIETFSPPHKILIDTGVVTPSFAKSSLASFQFGGQLLHALKDAGIAAEDITDVVLTQGRLDHFLGLVKQDGIRSFVNARVFVPKRDHVYWNAPKNNTDLDFSQIILPESGLYKYALKPYIQAKKFHLLHDRQSPIHGMSYTLYPGHSPGHGIIEFKHANLHLALISDGWIMQPLQLDHPNIETAFSMYGKQSVSSRKTLLSYLARKRPLVLAYHDTFPGLGYVRKRKSSWGYEWITASIEELQFGSKLACSS